jgi:copper(I)-binding protein
MLDRCNTIIGLIGGHRRKIGGDRRFQAWRSQALVLAAATVLASPVLADVTITDAWVRGTVPGQTSTGAYMKMKSTEDVKVVAASSPVAKAVEIHEMAMKGTTMEMRAVPALPLPAGKTVELKSGGYHVMLMGLSKPLGKGDVVPIAFTVEGAGGKRTTVEVKALVAPLVMKSEPLQKR